MIVRVLSWGLCFAYAALIWFISSLSTVSFPTDAFPLQDKGVHFFEFGALAAMLMLAVTSTRAWLSPARRIVFAGALATAYGAIDEVHQAFTPGRSSDLLDLCADMLGAFSLAAIAAWMLSVVAPRFWRTA